MKFSHAAPFALMASMAAAAPRKPMVTPEDLEGAISSDALLKHAQQLEDFAYSTAERNRLAGSTGHNLTVDYIFDTLRKLGSYNVEKQYFSLFVSKAVNSTLTVGRRSVPATSFAFSPNTTVEALMAPVANYGCEADDYDNDDLEGKIALISRGTCEFGLKSALAGSAGAVAAIIYNDVDGEFLGGTLGIPGRDEGDFVGTVGVSLEVGQTLLKKAKRGKAGAAIDVVSYYGKAYTCNVIAETKGGDHDNVLTIGAHTDSVSAGPGINDDGSGTVGILETAIHLSKYRVKNAVRFGFWSAEEEGLLGSTAYVQNLTEEERNKIRLYLNYDMIASPNFIYAIFDGDGDTFNVTGAPGSAAAEHLYEEWYTARNLSYTATPFANTSDYAPFLEANIPVGGLYTGSHEIKSAAGEDVFGGLAGVPLDPNYHTAGDDVANLDMEAFTVNAQLIAYSTAVYALSFDTLESADAQGQVQSQKTEGKAEHPPEYRESDPDHRIGSDH